MQVAKGEALRRLAFIASTQVSVSDAIPAAIAVVENAIPCLFGVLLMIDPEGRPLDAYLADPRPDVIEAFIGGQARLRATPGEPTLDRIVASGKLVGALDAYRGPALLKTAIYREVLAPYGTGVGLDLTLRHKDGQAFAILLLNRRLAEDRWSAREQALLAALAPLLSTILQTETANEQGPWCEPADRMGQLVVDRDGKVEFAAGEAHLMVAQFCGLRLSEGIAYRDLLLRLPPALMALLKHAQSSASVSARSPLQHTVVSPWGQILARLTPEAPHGPQHSAGRFHLVLERRMSRRAVVLHNVAMAPLSQRERELAFRIGMGELPEQICATMQIKPLTFKAYAKSVYAKIGVAGRPALIERLRTVPC